MPYRKNFIVSFLDTKETCEHSVGGMWDFLTFRRIYTKSWALKKLIKNYPLIF
jgi:hypothetical protein